MKKTNRIVQLFTDEGTLEVSRVENKVAYDQYNRPIPEEYLKFQLDVLQADWLNPNIEVKELAGS